MNKSERYISSLREIKDKLVIVTGANSGIGYNIAKIALIKGAKVVLACRNESRANKAKETLIKETNNSNIEIFLYDQNDINSINRFAQAIKEQYKNFYALVLNAGIMYPKDVVDEKGISSVYRTNFLGAYELMNKIDPFLKEANEEHRIIIQGSMASYFYKYKNKTKFLNGKYSDFKQYSLSKLCCSNLFINRAKNNKNMYVKYGLCEPGIVDTGLFKNMNKWVRIPSRIFMPMISNSGLNGSLPAATLLCEIMANGDYYKPAHLFSAKGLPKKHKFPNKLDNENIIIDAKETIKKYYE